MMMDGTTVLIVPDWFCFLVAIFILKSLVTKYVTFDNDQKAKKRAAEFVKENLKSYYVYSVERERPPAVHSHMFVFLSDDDLTDEVKDKVHEI